MRIQISLNFFIDIDYRAQIILRSKLENLSSCLTSKHSHTFLKSFYIIFFFFKSSFPNIAIISFILCVLLIFQHFAHAIIVLQLILLPTHIALDADVCLISQIFLCFVQTAVVEEGGGYKRIC